MLVRKGLVGMAAAVLAFGSAARASDSAPATGAAADAKLDSASPSTPVLLDDAAAPAPRKPLMAGLDKIGLAKPLDDLGINIFGYAEAGYYYDASSPKNNDGPDLTLFPGVHKNRLLLDQVDIAAERTVDASKGKFDIGFHVEAMYGTDATFIHSSGVLDNNVKNGNGPDNQIDVPQAYVTVAVPIGTGLTLEIGKFYTIIGYEVTNPTGNALYTHSYQYSFAEPITQTGILGTYNITDKLSVTAGVTRGWNQTLYDNNGAIDFLGGVTYKFSDKFTATVNLSEGPQATNDNGDYWTVAEAILAYSVSDQLKVAADLIYGDAPHALGSVSAQWYGAAAYASYTIDKHFTLNGRAEWYRDNDGFTTGVAANYYEGTVGLAITPLPDNQIFQYLVVRPEVRYDYADKPAFDSGDNNQLAFAVDAIMQF